MRAESIAVAALARMNREQPTVIGALEGGVVSVVSKTTNGANARSDYTAEAAGKEKQRKRSKTRRKEEPKFPVEPRVIQVVKKPRTFMNHSYRDFSSVPKELDYEVPTRIEDMTFPQKVHHMLCQEEYKRWISWMPHGRAFRILVPKRLEQGRVLEKYFGHSRYSSFLRQLSNHSFKLISRGRDRNCYYHEFMLRGLPHLAKYMPEPKDARRLIPDPDNEPDFYAISKENPLPDDPGFGKEPGEFFQKNPVSKAPATAGAARLASDVSWLQNQMPVAKRQAVQAPEVNPLLGIATSTQANQGLTGQAFLGGQLAQLQQAMQSNNQLLAVAALQEALKQAQQSPPVAIGGDNNNNSSTADALAALLRARSGLGPF